jgi:S-adenosylmethionine decarboxylase
MIATTIDIDHQTPYTGSSDGCLTDNNSSDGFSGSDAGSDDQQQPHHLIGATSCAPFASGHVGLFPSSGAEVEDAFEGPEKTVEVIFCPNIGVEGGLRSLTRCQLDELCRLAKCEILSHTANAHLDSYVLSESSLFVWEYKYIMKTCGTTTLLFCLAKLLEYATVLGMELAWVGFFRKNLNYPDAQVYPHTSFSDEVSYLNDVVSTQIQQAGKGFLVGPVTHDHLVVYSTCAAQIPRALAGVSTAQTTFTMMMFDMHEDVARHFFENNNATGLEMRKASGIASLVSGCIVDDTSFSPCGYSMNALLQDAYFTIHVTPEEDSSYVSFETNASYEQLGLTQHGDYAPLVERIALTFRPKRFVTQVVGSEAALAAGPSLPLDLNDLKPSSGVTYQRVDRSSVVAGADLSCAMATFQQTGQQAVQPFGAKKAVEKRGSVFDVEHAPLLAHVEVE